MLLEFRNRLARNMIENPGDRSRRHTATAVSV